MKSGLLAGVLAAVTLAGCSLGGPDVPSPPDVASLLKDSGCQRSDLPALTAPGRTESPAADVVVRPGDRDYTKEAMACTMNGQPLFVATFFHSGGENRWVAGAEAEKYALRAGQLWAVAGSSQTVVDNFANAVDLPKCVTDGEHDEVVKIGGYCT